jgi:hemerythrin superfamily protein
MASTPTRRRPSTGARRAKKHDAISLLRQDHENVTALFEHYERGHARFAENRRREIVRQICRELTVHATIEEEIFYPAVAEQVRGAEDLVQEAQVEHESIKRLVAELESSKPDGELYDAKVSVLAEYVKHHVREEQNELFPKVRKSKLDLDAIGRELETRKAELTGK